MDLMRDRIKRVMDNHQMSCQITIRNLYVLKGFAPVIDNIDFPVSKLDGDLSGRSNKYILEEDWDGQEVDGFIPIEVFFNFFENGILNDKGEIVGYEPTDKKPIYIFNTNNALTGLVDDLTWDDSKRLDYLKSIDMVKL